MPVSGNEGATGIMTSDPERPQRACRLIRSVLSFFLVLVAALPAWAHEIRPAVVDLQLAPDGGYRAEIRLNLEAMLAGIDPAHRDSDDSANAPVYDRLRRMPPAQVQREFETFSEDFLESLEILADGAGLRPAVERILVPEVGDPALARDSVIRIAGRLPAAARALTWRWDSRLGPSVLRVGSEAQPELYTAYLAPGEASDAIALDGVVAQPAWAVFRNYVVIGFEHIVPKGADHILFVVGLFLLSPRWRTLLWQVSAFTLAHTLTLALSMLGWVALPADLVEPLIAASIVYVCVENLFHQRLTRWRPLVVFGFGLLHGLGFASVLTDVGLSPGHFVAGLVGFNIGVEFGQLAVLGLCFLLVGLWFRHRLWYRRIIAVPASLAIALVGSYWFVERTLLV